MDEEMDEDAFIVRGVALFLAVGAKLANSIKNATYPTTHNEEDSVTLRRAQRFEGYLRHGEDPH